MLDFSVTKDQLAIEKLFCEPFNALVPKTDNMSLEDKKMLLDVMSMPEDLDKNEKYVAQLNKIPIFVSINQLLEKHFTVKLCLRTKFWLGHIAKDPINVFPYLVYVQYRAKQMEKQMINFRIFCEKIFPEGFPKFHEVNSLVVSLVVDTNESGAQKLLLSYTDAMKSIQFGFKISDDISGENIDEGLFEKTDFQRKMESKFKNTKQEMPSLMQLISKTSIFKK